MTYMIANESGRYAGWNGETREWFEVLGHGYAYRCPDIHSAFKCCKAMQAAFPNAEWRLVTIGGAS